MKNIQDFIVNEKKDVEIDNVIISGSGSMNGYANEILAKFPNAKKWLYDTLKDKVIPLNGEWKSTGPHNNDLKGICEFIEKHIGEMTIFIQN